MTHVVLEMMDLGISKEDLYIDQILFSNFSYEQEFIKIITSPEICINALNVNDTVRHADKTIKIEAMERFSETLYRLCRRIADELNHDGPVTCHLFLSRINSDSFPSHTDPDDVLLYVVDGEKTIILSNETVTLTPGQALFMPYGTVHQAINRKDSIMLSFGLERYTLEKLES
jgi:mannose-6-phosphate isomerase-like protein (cupin superfamily)